MLATHLRNAAFAAGLNITRQTPVADVLALVQTLRPQDCGRKLIRIGSDGDGGYLLPDDLEGLQYCFSPGVSNVADFEAHLADLKIHSFLADYSVDAPPISRQEFTFDKKFLGATDNDVYFTLSSWKNKYLADYRDDLLLQMDIEGSEYDVLLETPAALLETFRIVVIEFHHLDRLFDPVAFRIYRSCFEKLLKAFHVAHIHPNNTGGSVSRGRVIIPRTMEFTFYNKKRAASIKPAAAFPHPLDSENIRGLRALPLPECWYK